MDQLFLLFPDHYPQLLEEQANTWILELAWSTDPHWFVDPLVASVSQHLFQLPLEAITPFYQQGQFDKTDFIFSMFHSRALLAASYATQRGQGQPFSCIIHVDDHTDLMPALVTASDKPGVLTNSLSQRQLDITIPSSMIQAIDEGIIHKGSFLTTYLLATRPGSLIHVSDRLDAHESWLIPTINELFIGGNHLRQMGVVPKQEQSPGAWHFRQTGTLPQDLPEDIAKAVWLDVDLDAFCNRYDGDSDRTALVETEGERIMMEQRIETFLDQLSKATWIDQIEAVSVAVSPGFFPAEYWEYAIPMVCNGIEHII